MVIFAFWEEEGEREGLAQPVEVPVYTVSWPMVIKRQSYRKPRAS